MSKDFDIQIKCKKCGSTDVHICKHMDFTGWEDNIDYTNDIALVCKAESCYNREVIKLQYQITL
jgi:hypothetical protein